VPRIRIPHVQGTQREHAHYAMHMCRRVGRV
jgi:hypothetical protein